MAEAFYNTLTGTNDALSAGARAKGVDRISERAIEVMHEIGIDVEHLKSDQLTDEMVEAADRVIYFPTPFMPETVTKNQKAELWDVADPFYNKDKGMEFVRMVRDDIRARVEALIQEKTRITE